MSSFFFFEKGGGGFKLHVYPVMYPFQKIYFILSVSGYQTSKVRLSIGFSLGSYVYTNR